MFDFKPLRKQGEKEIARFKREFENLVEKFLNRDFPSVKEFLKEDNYIPKMDVIESSTEIEIKAEFPGMDAGDIDLRLEGRFLQLKGEKIQEKEEKDVSYHRMERNYGSFNRTIELPAEVDKDSVDASFRKGVLRVVLQKVKSSETRKIEIKTS